MAGPFHLGRWRKVGWVRLRVTVYAPEIENAYDAWGTNLREHLPKSCQSIRRNPNWSNFGSFGSFFLRDQQAGIATTSQDDGQLFGNSLAIGKNDPMPRFASHFTRRRLIRGRADARLFFDGRRV